MTTIIRNPIVTVLGHVDHGKTSLLDAIRKSRIKVASKEPGAITQHIGATNISIDHVKVLCGDKYKKFFENLKIKGLLFIDTPGHAAFTNLRKRGGSIADLAILVIDVNEGLMPQTIESIQILKTFKVPYVIALNKIDKISGWDLHSDAKNQDDFATEKFDEKFYKLVEEFSKYGLTIEKFYNMKKEDFTRAIACVPVSAIFNYGISDLLMVLIGLSQQYLIKKLEIDDNAPGEGVILEVKEEKGFGTTIDVILYNGRIRKDDDIVVGGKKPILTKVRNLLLPPSESEMRISRKFLNVDEVIAAAGLKIYSPDLKDAIAGMPVYVGKDIEKVKKEISEISTSEKGVIIKTDSLGALEALANMLKEKGIPIKKGEVGKVNKDDVININMIKSENEEIGVIFVFNTQILDDANKLIEENKIKVFKGDVIYKMVEDYIEWRETIKKESLKPCKIQFLKGYVFHNSDPAIIGVRVLVGEIRKNLKLINENGRIIGTIKSIQLDKDHPLEIAKKDDEVAIAIDKGVVGRNIEEGDILYSFLTYEEISKIDRSSLTYEEKEILDFIIDMKIKVEEK